MIFNLSYIIFPPANSIKERKKTYEGIPTKDQKIPYYDTIGQKLKTDRTREMFRPFTNV